MKLLEIIELCTAHADHQFLYEQADSLGKLASREAGLRANVFWNGFVDTDLSVHLHYNSESDTASFSAVGEQVASALKEYGLVRHTIWIQHI